MENAIRHPFARSAPACATQRALFSCWKAFHHFPPARDSPPALRSADAPRRKSAPRMRATGGKRRPASFRVGHPCLCDAIRAVFLLESVPPFPARARCPPRSAPQTPRAGKARLVSPMHTAPEKRWPASLRADLPTKACNRNFQPPGQIGLLCGNRAVAAINVVARPQSPASRPERALTRRLRSAPQRALFQGFVPMFQWIGLAAFADCRTTENSASGAKDVRPCAARRAIAPRRAKPAHRPCGSARSAGGSAPRRNRAAQGALCFFADRANEKTAPRTSAERRAVLPLNR